MSVSKGWVDGRMSDGEDLITGACRQQGRRTGQVGAGGQNRQEEKEASLHLRLRMSAMTGSGAGDVVSEG